MFTVYCQRYTQWTYSSQVHRVLSAMHTVNIFQSGSPCTVSDTHSEHIPVRFTVYCQRSTQWTYSSQVHRVLSAIHTGLHRCVILNQNYHLLMCDIYGNQMGLSMNNRFFHPGVAVLNGVISERCRNHGLYARAGASKLPLLFLGQAPLAQSHDTIKSMETELA